MGLTAVNPADNAGGIMTWKIIVNGTIIPDVCAILSIKVHNKVNEIPTAAIVMADDSQDSEFALSSSSIFIPGGSIVIAAGYDTVDETIFSGKITAQSMRIEQSVGSVLEIECSDEATNMHQDKKSRTFIDKKDSDVILTVISENRLLGTVTRTETEYAEVIQYGQTDWEFVLAKAKANNMMVITQDGTITVVPPSVDRESVLTVTNGVSILGFEGQWNVSSAPDMIYRDFSKIQGNVRFQGCALAKTGTCIDMEGLGTRFSGKHLVSAVTHSIEDGDWITEATIG
ncbi:MAG: vgrG, partial [Flavipsychrobacter sp.]|nr:vgrG [Flavipsychrobacter sp.]